MSQARLFVSNLSFQTRENNLQDYTAAAGAEVSVNLMLDRMNGRSRGFAFVEFGPPKKPRKPLHSFTTKIFKAVKSPSASPGRVKNALRAATGSAEVNDENVIDQIHPVRPDGLRPVRLFCLRIKFDSPFVRHILNGKHYG